MSERPTTSASSTPYTANNLPRPLTGWSESEAPSTSTSDGPYPAHHYQHQHQQAQAQHLPQQHNLYAQQDQGYNENDNDDEGNVFAFGPPLTPEHPPQPHQIRYSQHQYQQDMSPHQYLSAAQLHNQAAAAGLFTSTDALPPPPSSIPDSQTAPNSRHYYPPETSSSYEYEPGPNSHEMRPIPVNPGILETRHTNPTLGPIAYAHIPAHESLQVVFPTAAISNNSSMLFPAQLKRASSDPNASAVELGSQDVTISYKLSDMDPAEEEEDSPYAEVRASVNNMDDPEMPTMTFRVWFLGLTLVCISASLNTFLNFRYPAPLFLPSLVLLIAYPFGKALAFVLPIRTWVLPRILGGGKGSLNPGPFNVKEHVLIYMMVNVGAVPFYVMNAIVVADKYYGLSFGPGFEILLLLATTLTGFGFAGLCRRLLVNPASMIWPQNLVSCALLNTLHAEEDDRTTGISRYKFFIYAMIGAFLWMFLPGLLFVGLSFFSWVCWIAPSAYLFSLYLGRWRGN